MFEQILRKLIAIMHKKNVTYLLVISKYFERNNLRCFVQWICFVRWFCSAPMSDGFLVLAHIQDEKSGPNQSLSVPSCFFVPRWLPNGERNPFYIQRLKDKLGNRSNASSEIEFNNTQAVRHPFALN